MEKEVIKDEKETITLKNEEEYKKALKYFTIIIKETESGKELVNEQTNVILGCYNKINEDNKLGSDGTAQLVAMHCNTPIRLLTIEGLGELVKELKTNAVKDSLKTLLSKLEKEGGNNEE